MPDIGQGITGGLGGAATGAALGSIIAPGIGTLIGGGAGALLGGLAGTFGSNRPKPNRDDFLLPGYDQRAQNLLGLSGQFGTSDERARSAQSDLISLLQRGAAGTGPSAARAMLQETTNQNIAQQQALASTGRSNQAFLARQALGNAADIQQRAANQASLVRAQEQQSAQGLLGNVVGTQRSQDIQQLDLNRRAQLAALEQELRNAQLQQQGTMGYQQALLGAASIPGLGDQLLSGGGSLLAAQLSARGRN